MKTRGIARVLTAVALAWSLGLTVWSQPAAAKAKSKSKKPNFAHLAEDPLISGKPSLSKKKKTKIAAKSSKKSTAKVAKKSSKKPSREIASVATSGAMKGKEAKLKKLGVSEKKIKLVIEREKAHEASVKKLSQGKIPIDRKIMREKLERSHAQWLKVALGAKLYQDYAGGEYRDDIASHLNPYRASKSELRAASEIESPDSLFVPTESKSIDFSEGGSSTVKSNEPVFRTRDTASPPPTQTAVANLPDDTFASPPSIEEGEPANVNIDISDEPMDPDL